MNKTDTYDALPHNSEALGYQKEVFQKIWSEANELRRSGKLLQLGKQIMCPVVAIHGDYDSPPAQGVKYPFSHFLKNFRFVMLRASFMRFSKKNYARMTATMDVLPKVDLKLLEHIVLSLAMTEKCVARVFLHPVDFMGIFL